MSARGIIPVRNAAAMCTFQKVTFSSWVRYAIATWIILRSFDWTAISGQIKACHCPRNMSQLTQMMPGFDKRTQTCQKILNHPAPSINAASTNSEGMPRKNWRKRKMANP